MRRRIEGFDYLRVIMFIFVVVWHMKGFGESLIFNKNNYADHIFTISDLLNFHILLLAVPVFIFISVYLYSQNSTDVNTLKKRLKRLFLLTSFWILFANIIQNGIKEGLYSLIPYSFNSLVSIVLTGGHTIYYFFISLMISIIAAHLFIKINTKIQVVIFILSVFLLESLPLISNTYGISILSAYWSPINFFPIVFAAVLTSQNIIFIKQKQNTFIIASFVFYIIFSYFEWNYMQGNAVFNGQGYAIPAYTRASLTFGSFIVILISINPNIKSTTFIKSMSGNALAIYVLHIYFIGSIKKITNFILGSNIISLWVSIFLVILFSYIAAVLLRIYLKKELLE